MRKRILILFLAMAGIILSSLGMSGIQALNGASSRQSALGDAQEVGLILVRLFGLQEIAVGFLWLQFDFDSSNALGNYHRLIPTLNAITWLNPAELDAWSLKGYMRFARGKRLGKDWMIQEGLSDFQRAIAANPGRWEFPFEVGRLAYFELASPALALPFLEKAQTFPGHHVYVDRILSEVYVDLGRKQDAVKCLRELLKREDIDTVERGKWEWRLKMLDR